MIDLPPEPPAWSGAAPAEGLRACGLDPDGFQITYEEDLQGYLIEISERAGATSDNLQCVWDATWPEFVRFKEEGLQAAYEDLTQGRFAPLAIQSARDHLAERGLLEGLPDRADFPAHEAFIAAIEQHCGVVNRRRLGMSEDGTVTFDPGGEADIADHGETACLFSALAAAGETRFGFVGNEKSVEPPGE